jgi:cytoskeletal protein CcmA (bactofilin family)
MFANKDDNKRKPKGIDGQELNLIGSGTSIAGDINSTGDLRIDGNVKGNVVSKARLVLGPNGTIDGDIQAQNADIQGSVKGRVTISEILFLKGTARIDGDILTNKLVVESGASFNGNCVMKSGMRSQEGAQFNEVRKPKAAETAGV